MLLSKMQLSPIGAHCGPEGANPSTSWSPFFTWPSRMGQLTPRPSSVCISDGQGTSSLSLSPAFSEAMDTIEGASHSTKKTDLPPPVPVQVTEAGQFLSLKSPFCHLTSDS